jgi:hypothetical protein
MGITTASLNRLNKFNLLDRNRKYRMLELGCQNIYDNSYEGVSNQMIAKNYFTSLGVEHTSWDITGCQCSEKIDLRDILYLSKYGQFDVITDYGTLEHVENIEKGGFYEAYSNIHSLCKEGGLMIHESPAIGHWIGHGFNYVSQEFFIQLAKDNGYNVLEITMEYAMGNTTDAGLICCVLEKKSNNNFISKDIFNSYNFISYNDLDYKIKYQL